MIAKNGFWEGALSGVLVGVIAFTVVVSIFGLRDTVEVAEWSEVSVPHQSEPLRVPARVTYSGVEYDCVLVGDAPTVVGHNHEWSRTLDGDPVSGAECVSCGEVNP